VVGVGAVAEIDTEYVGAGQRQFTDLRRLAAGGSECRDDSGSARSDHGRRLRLRETTISRHVRHSVSRKVGAGMTRLHILES
jgi:hypothetical protein